jgi:hypothetical protein
MAKASNNGAINGIVSKERVNNFGEVYTPDFIVNDMLDMVDAEMDKTDLWKYIDTTYMEPSCGNGQFLIRILDRKIKAVNQLPAEDREFGIVRAVCSIYGVDIQQDNVMNSKKRMKRLIYEGEADTFNPNDKEIPEFTQLDCEISEPIKKVINRVLDNNIIFGNTLETSDDSKMLVKVIEYKFNPDGSGVVTAHKLTDMEGMYGKEHKFTKLACLASKSMNDFDKDEDDYAEDEGFGGF